MSKQPLLWLLSVLLLVAGCAAAPVPLPTSAPTPLPVPTPTPVPPKQVLLIAQEFSLDMELMLTKEVGVMVAMLEKAGYKVVVATASGQPIKTINAALKPDLTLAAVKLDDYAGVILPCMATAKTMVALAGPPEAVEIVKQAVAKNKVVAAQDASVYLLAQAGVLKGKQYAVYDGNTYEKVPEAIYKGTGVVQDGNLITSGKCPMVAVVHQVPDTTVDVTLKFIEALAASR
ncbi:MAG: DJ-1/PfpI family protein [Chloroflexi bacterium]|nr:DJ-1/PfpI family protein [Chloroflexota bacterium]